MTSNLGAEKLQKEASLGFHVSTKRDQDDLDVLHKNNQEKVRDELKKMLRPELLNRIDKTIVFRALTKKDVIKIMDLQINELRERLVKHGIGLQVTKTAKEYLLEHGYDPLNGVRPLRRLIQDTIEDHIAFKLLDESYQPGAVIKVGAKAKNLAYDTISE
jgi:ATP-dependent Clp protease ATP-binding subunit ClpC